MPDLQEEPESLGAVKGISTLEVKTIEMARERTRATVVLTLLVLLGLIILLPIIPAVFGADSKLTDTHWDVIKISLSGLLGLVGSAIGFYFRSHQESK